MRAAAFLLALLVASPVAARSEAELLAEADAMLAQAGSGGRCGKEIEELRRLRKAIRPLQGAQRRATRKKLESALVGAQICDVARRMENSCGKGITPGPGGSLPDDRETGPVPRATLELALLEIEGYAPDQKPKLLGVVKRRAAAFRSCYQRQLERNHGLQGKVELMFRIDDQGRVLGVVPRSDSTGDAGLERCLRGRGRQLRFPPPGKQAQLLVELRFRAERQP